MEYKFIERKDILLYIDELTLNGLTINDDNMLIELEHIAISEIDGYIGAKYITEEIFNKKGTDRNSYLVSSIVDIILFHLYSRVAPNNIPSIRMQRYGKIIEYMADIGKGKIAPNLPVRDNEFTRRSDQILFGGFNKINNAQL